MRLNIATKIMLLSILITVGLLIPGWIGYLATTNIYHAAEASLDENQQIRETLSQRYNDALQSESIAGQLTDLNRRLIELTEMVIIGPKRGITIDQLIETAKTLTKDAQFIYTVPGNNRPISQKSKLTLGKVTLNNFEDIEVLFEYDLPDYYAAKNSTIEFRRLQGEMALNLANTYSFISRNLKALSAASQENVQYSLTTLAEAQLATDLAMAEVRQKLVVLTEQTSLRLLITFVITTLLLLVSFAIFAKNMTNPIHAVVKMADSLQLGHVSARLDIGSRNDEFGDMAQALNNFAENLEHELVAAMQKLATGNFDLQLRATDSQDLIRVAIQSTATQLSQVVTEILVASERIAVNSRQVAADSQSLADTTSSSSAALEEVNSSMTEISSQIEESACATDQVNTLAEKANVAAKKGTEQMELLATSILEIETSSKEISCVIKTIDEIAFQTNLLALNAAVEAARAGQHGKGFAIVAEEVRNLAVRSATAAAETTAMIEDSITKTLNGVKLTQQTSVALIDIANAVVQVTDLVGKITLTSHEQEQGITQISIGLTQLDLEVQQNTATSERSAVAAEQLSQQSTQLKQMLTQFILPQR